MPEHLADLSSQDRLRVLGDALAVRVRDYDSQYVGIIVDVLLQLPTSEVLGLLDHSDALERSVAAVQHQLGLPATTSIPAPRNVAPDPVGPHIPRSGAEQVPQGSMINRQPLAQSLTPAPQAAMQSVPISTSRETKASWRSSVTGMLSEIISGVQDSVGFRPGQGSRQGVGLSNRGSGRSRSRFPQRGYECPSSQLFESYRCSACLLWPYIPNLP